MSSDLAISVKRISKRYEIFDTPKHRLKQFLWPRFRKCFGQPSVNYFHEFWAVRNISFDVGHGETVGIIGRNGCGKSTLLQLICKTLNPTEGTIQTHGRVAALLELGSGFNMEFTGRENVYMNGGILGLSKQEIDERLEVIISFANIGEFIDRPVKIYSSGMYVRLAFAVAISVEPDILVIDEALAVGDEAFQRKCFHHIETLKEKGCSILFVSHSVRHLPSPNLRCYARGPARNFFPTC